MNTARVLSLICLHNLRSHNTFSSVEITLNQAYTAMATQPSLYIMLKESSLLLCLVEQKQTVANFKARSFPG